MLRLALRSLVPAALAVGCAADGADPAASGTPPPPLTGAADTTGGDPTGADATVGASTGLSGQAACNACGADEFCSAPFQAGTLDPDALDYACGQVCVAVGDGSRWCGNDAACCEGTCDAFGRCGAGVLDDATGSSSDGGTTGASSGGGTTTVSTDGSTTTTTTTTTGGSMGSSGSSTGGTT